MSFVKSVVENNIIIGITAVVGAGACSALTRMNFISVAARTGAVAGAFFIATALLANDVRCELIGLKKIKTLPRNSTAKTLLNSDRLGFIVSMVLGGFATKVVLTSMAHRTVIHLAIGTGILSSILRSRYI